MGPVGGFGTFGWVNGFGQVNGFGLTLSPLLFSVFWPIKVVIILFNDYSVIVNRFILDSFTKYIILVLKLFVNVL